jgi:3-oxoadipate enol-lactonase
MARDAVRVLDHAGVPRAHVVGISLGGMIAQRLAIDHPSRVDRLVLGCTSGGGLAGPGATAGATLALLRAATLPPARAARRMAPFLLSRRFLESRPDIVDLWAKIAAREPVPRAGIAGQIAAALLHDASRELHEIRARTLVVTGDADRMIPPSRSRRLHAAIPGSRLELLPGVGHDFPTEASEDTVRLLVGFLLG